MMWSALCWTSLSSGATAALTVHSDFEGGSGETVSIDSERQAIHLRPALREGRGWPCWWYVRIEGAVVGAAFELTVSGNPGPFRPGGAALAANWAQPVRAAISKDDVVWTQSPNGVADTQNRTMTYRFEAPGERFWLAWGPPFTPRHGAKLIEDLVAQLPGSEAFVLATSRDGRPVPGIRMGRADAPAAIWVQARQHAWEAGSSWTGRGFAEWVAGDDPEARRLRESTTIYFVPIMDVDNVARGAGGKESVPRDHNRDWSGEPVYPEVAAAQGRIAELDQAGRLRMFIDLHNPGPGDKRTFFFGPFGYEEMAPPVRAGYDRFIQFAAKRIQGPPAVESAYRFATYVRTDEERGRMSSGWVRKHTDPTRTISVTLEAAWNTPDNTADGYRQTGRQLAAAVADYLSAPTAKAGE
ncbi:MAG: hypothetical protein JNK37_01600 [Verrucomicrobiales bacterium]|nr:hypothetical protein [Verrucomicrobiales bacterium]